MRFAGRLLRSATVLDKHRLSVFIVALACCGRADSPPGTADAKAEANPAAAPPAAEPNPVEPAPIVAEPLPVADVQLEAADGLVVHGMHYPTTAGAQRPIVLLFHQARSNAAEYGPIAPRLQGLGYAALAIDQRSGGTRHDRDNLTVKAEGASTQFGAAYADLEAALAWAQARGHKRIIAWGSSYSAALIFRLASEHGDALTAALSFSPGEYMGPDGTVAAWAREVPVPVFITSAPGKEVAAAKALADAVGARAEHHVPTDGVHGSSTLHNSRNPAGHQQVWTAVEAFLQRVAP